MATLSSISALKEKINLLIKRNQVKAITGPVANEVLIDMVDTLSKFNGNGTDYVITAQTVQVIVHNLGKKFPRVTVTNAAGVQVNPGLTYNNANQLTLTFNPAFTGIANIQ